MGYDVSFHPISPEEMREWYFTPLTWIQQGQEEKVLALAAQHGMEDFYAEKYLDTLRVGAETEPDELFDKSHGFYIAVIQGFFRDYYYTRGSSFSLLMEEKPEYVRYFTPWAQVVPTAFPNPAENQIIENYCSGVYLSRDQVTQLLRDLEQEPKVLEDLEGVWSDGQLAVLKKALVAAAELGVGLLEATEVVEPMHIGVLGLLRWVHRRTMRIPGVTGAEVSLRALRIGNQSRSQDRMIQRKRERGRKSNLRARCPSLSPLQSKSPKSRCSPRRRWQSPIRSSRSSRICRQWKKTIPM